MNFDGQWAMKKKSRNSKRARIKQREFRDQNISPLESLRREGKTVKSPFAALSGTIQTRSWSNESIPNILWACILASSLERDDYLALFRTVTQNAREKIASYETTFVTHNFLAVLNNTDFDAMFADVLNHPAARNALKALRLIESLPDRPHWDRHLDQPSPKDDWNIISRAVFETFDHQAEKATDVRWLKVMHFIACGKIHFPQQMAERVEEYRLYPNKGDMRSVCPSIRALEIGFRDLEAGEGLPKEIALPPNLSPSFWLETKRKTECIFPGKFEPPLSATKDFAVQVARIFEAAQNHFDATISTTAPAPRHDGTFGLVFYALSLLLNAVASRGHTILEGRIVLRSIVEIFITLEYLAKKDDQTLWLQYRTYGNGQAKLAFLKNIREDTVPEFIDLKKMEHLANEDMWMEYQDIELGHWANLNLRKMAEEANVKDTYDKFYDWTSGYTHGHWVCVRDAVFVNCLNPLHRFHRVPGSPIPRMPSVLTDASGLINRMLDTLSMLYPNFKLRLKKPETDSVEREAGDGQPTKQEPNAEGC